jgi:electron transfer flavoprotein beta subunit
VKIAVCVKSVPDGASGRRIDEGSKRLDRSGELALSDFDTHAVEEALRVRDAVGGGEVVVVSMGPERAADAARKTLAMGADRSVLVTDDGLAGADLLVTARVLAGVLERETPDLVLFGQQSSDGDGACLWAAVAELWRRPVISQVSELVVEGGSATGKRQTEYGYERVRAPQPVVVAVSDAINEPRYPSLKGIMGAKSKPQEVLTAADVGGVSEPRTVVLALSAPPARGEGRRVEDDGNAAEAIVEFLAERRML